MKNSSSKHRIFVPNVPILLYKYIYGKNMKKLRNKKGEKLMVDVSGRRAVLKNEDGSTAYTAFIDFDKNNDYEKIIGIKLVNCF